MIAPNYTWSCHKCEKSNPPYTTNCTHCGFQAIACTDEINPGSEEDKQKQKQTSNFDFFLFMPEALLALAIAVYTPIRTLKLIISSHYSAAALLIIVTLACGCGFIWAIKNKAKMIAYFAMMGFIATAISIGTWIAP